VKPDRLSFIDWTRGLGATIMLQGHAFHSFTHPSLRESPAWIYSQFVGGMPPAIFLFLTGVTLAFLMDSLEKKGFSNGQRIIGALKRSRYLFLLAFGFRIQMFLFGWPRPWEDIFKVDVLNCMGFSVAALSLMAVFSTAERARLSAALGVAISVASPVMAQLDWTRVPSIIQHYLAPDGVLFGFFPWAAFLAFGLAIGSAPAPPEHVHVQAPLFRQSRQGKLGQSGVGNFLQRDSDLFAVMLQGTVIIDCVVFGVLSQAGFEEAHAQGGVHRRQRHLPDPDDGDGPF